MRNGSTNVGKNNAQYENNRHLYDLVSPYGDGRAAERIIRALKGIALDGLLFKRISMIDELALLFLNAGRRVELTLSCRVAFKELRVAGRIITTDTNEIAPALYLGDEQYSLPRSGRLVFLNSSAICGFIHRFLLSVRKDSAS